MSTPKQRVEARIAGEKAVVRGLVEHMHKFGWHAVEVDDGGDERAIKVDYEPGLSADEVIDHAFAVDEAHVYFKDGLGHTGWVFLVFGNEPHEVINDYSAKVEFDVVMEEFHPEEYLPVPDGQKVGGAHP